MAIKSVTGGKDMDETEFPKLMKHITGKGGIWIVLFIAKDVGTLVYCDDGHEEIGYVSDHWGYEDFLNFPGTITLSNE